MWGDPHPNGMVLAGWAESPNEVFSEHSAPKKRVSVLEESVSARELGKLELTKGTQNGRQPLRRVRNRDRLLRTAKPVIDSSYQLKAEGKGVEPSTGCPAPDFESGC
jgi:hypothetical protein